MTTDQLFADRYRLDRRLGLGGMATVQLAFDTRLERYVAVKLLAEHLAEDASFISRFRREALAAARLVHPNIVQVFDFGTDPLSERQFIVMEFVDGPSCADILRERGQLPATEAVSILTQACRGLDFAHRHGVIHRDVKPGNLLRNPEGQVKLADFGIAKAAEQSDITKVGSVLGTAAYLAPEQVRGEPAGPSVDLYALGVVAYQLLTGRLPYDAASLPELARQQASGSPPAPDRLAAGVPPALAAAVVRAMAPTPAGRYADAVELERALADGLHGIAAPPTSATRALAGDDQVTRVITGDATLPTTALPPQRPRRVLEPLPEAPGRERVAPAPAPQPAPSRRQRRPQAATPAPPPRRWSGLKLFLGLLLALLAVVVGGVTYQAVSEQSQRAVELKEQVEGDLDRSVDEIKDLIRDNTR